MIRLHPIFAMPVLWGCIASPSPPAIDAAAPAFAPIAFFSGRTEGNGVLKVAMSNARKVHIEGDGHVASDGSLSLVQRVEQEGKPSRSRRWELHPVGDGTYAGSLSDAVGPVIVKVDGNLLHIRFRARGGLGIEQRLALQPGGGTALNHLVVRKFGIRLAVLDETIRKIN